MREQRKFICLAEREQVREIKVVISFGGNHYGKCEISPYLGTDYVKYMLKRSKDGFLSIFFD